MKTLNVRQIGLTNGYNHTAKHEIGFPEYGDNGWYNIIRSYNAFFNSAKGRSRSRSPKYLYTVIDARKQARIDRIGETAYALLNEIDKWECDRDNALPVVEHESLYAFYEYIGYDRKRKKILDVIC